MTGRLAGGDLEVVGAGPGVDVSLFGDNSIDLFVYQQKVGSSVATLVFSEQSWDGEALEIPELTSGAKYFFTADLSEDGAVSLSVNPEITVMTISNDLLDYTVDSGATISGTIGEDDTRNFFDDDQNVDNNIFVKGEAKILDVNGEDISDTSIPINGRFGSLEISSNGVYEYTLFNDDSNNFRSNEGNYGDNESFKLTIESSDGQTSEEFFNISLDFTLEEIKEFSLTSGPDNLLFDEGIDAVDLDGIDNVEQENLVSIIDTEEEGNPIDLSGLLQDEGEEDDLSIDVLVTNGEDDNIISIDPRGDDIISIVAPDNSDNEPILVPNIDDSENDVLNLMIM